MKIPFFRNFGFVDYFFRFITFYEEKEILQKIPLIAKLEVQ